MSVLRPLLLCLLVVTFGCRETLVPAVQIEEGENPTQEWDRALRYVVTPDGYVNYKALNERRDVLERYVAWLALDIGWRKDRVTERPADYINAYNALVMYQIVERNLSTSVMDVPSLIPIAGAGFFATTDFQIGGDKLSLAEIENERVRHSMLDYRVHAALNCGSRSCPPLRASLYTQRGLQMQLREQMGRWINDPRGLEIDPDGNLVFNPIFKWFELDFTFWSAGKDLCEIAARHAKGYLSTDLLKRSREGCAHTYFEYDWSLNTATPRQTAP